MRPSYLSKQHFKHARPKQHGSPLVRSRHGSSNRLLAAQRDEISFPGQDGGFTSPRINISNVIRCRLKISGSQCCRLKLSTCGKCTGDGRATSALASIGEINADAHSRNTCFRLKCGNILLKPRDGLNYQARMPRPRGAPHRRGASKNKYAYRYQ